MLMILPNLEKCFSIGPNEFKFLGIFRTTKDDFRSQRETRLFGGWFALYDNARTSIIFDCLVGLGCERLGGIWGTWLLGRYGVSKDTSDMLSSGIFSESSVPSSGVWESIGRKSTWECRQDEGCMSRIFLKGPMKYHDRNWHLVMEASSSSSCKYLQRQLLITTGRQSTLALSANVNWRRLILFYWKFFNNSNALLNILNSVQLTVVPLR